MAPAQAGIWRRAEDCRGFFQAIYDDEACRFENAWAYWAKMNKEPWADRFEAEKRACAACCLENKGIFIEGNGNELLVPLQGRGHAANVYLFAESGFNEHAAGVLRRHQRLVLRAWGWSWRAPSISTARHRAAHLRALGLSTS